MARSAFGTYDKKRVAGWASDTFFIYSPYRYHLWPFECFSGWVVVIFELGCGFLLENSKAHHV